MTSKKDEKKVGLQQVTGKENTVLSKQKNDDG